MCGRFTLRSSPQAVAEAFGLAAIIPSSWVVSTNRTVLLPKRAAPGRAMDSRAGLPYARS